MKIEKHPMENGRKTPSLEVATKKAQKNPGFNSVELRKIIMIYLLVNFARYLHLKLYCL